MFSFMRSNAFQENKVYKNQRDRQKSCVPHAFHMRSNGQGMRSKKKSEKKFLTHKAKQGLSCEQVR